MVLGSLSAFSNLFNKYKKMIVFKQNNISRYPMKKQTNYINKFLFFILLSFSLLHAEEEPSQPPAINEQVCSPVNCYTITQELGEGAFGKVFAVRDSQGHPFAMKWYKPISQSYGEFWNTLGDVQREFENGQRLQHPNIIRSHELFKGTAEDYYLILELVEGKTIYKTMRKTLSLDQALLYARQLIDVLSHAEAEGFLFWDLHGNNVMLGNKDPGLKMVDLASFFSWEEVLSIPLVGRPQFPSLRNAIAKAAAPLPQRLQKLQKIFEEDPILGPALENRKAAFAQREGLIRKGSPDTEDPRYLNLIYAAYFSRITDCCVDIIKKGKEDTETKVARIATIKLLAWTFLEKAQDGIVDRSFADYLKALKEAVSHS